MDLAESRAWEAGLRGWSDDILPWIARVAPLLPKPALVVEVGSLEGRSLIFWGQTLRHLGHGAATRVTGVDMPYHEPGSTERLLANVARYRSTWGEVDVELDLRPSVEAAESYRSLDLVFVDADHAEASVRADIAAWLPRVRHGGVLAGHDYGSAYDGTEHWPGVKTAVDELLGPNSVRVEGSVWWVTVP